ncbi:MAG: HNH endonuclease [Acidobacteria bacterium]|nr:HNH endonuclease [Acidobacteriota bacterium]
MNPHYTYVADRALHRCEYCRAPEEGFNFHFEIEHITPLSHGGSDDKDNLALACTACNLFKWRYIVAFDEDTQSDVHLFHPRQDLWEEHFHLDFATGEIKGLTATGRATVACLRINSAAQLRARRLWIAQGLYS